MTRHQTSRLQLCLTTFGVIIGIVGILHGSAELLRGAALVESRSVAALPTDWPNPSFYTLTHGSPVFSILTGIPFYALGLLAITVSIALITLSLAVIRLNAFGLMLFGLLSLGIFMFGAGRGTPVVISLPALVTCALFLVMSGGVVRSDARKAAIRTAFTGFYGAHIASWILFFPGLFILSFYMDIPTWLFVVAFFSMPVSSLGSLVCAFLYDRTQ